MANLEPLQTENLTDKFAWEKPERKDQAGSLVIFGGLSFKLKEVDSIFKSAKAYGVGSVFALVPESLAKVFKRDDPYLIPMALDSYFGLTDAGVNKLKEEYALADALIVSDIGNNSSTILKLAKLISNSIKPVILTDSAIALVLSFTSEILQNPRTVLILNFQNLQKLIKTSGIELTEPLTSNLSISKKIEITNQFSNRIKANLVLIDEKRVIASSDNIYLNQDLKIPTLNLAARLAAWSIWSPSTSFLEQVAISISI